MRGKVEEDLAAAEMTSKGLVRQLQSAKAANREQFEQSTKMHHLLDCSMKELAGTKGANANLVAELRVAKQDIARKASELEGAKKQGENDLALESRKRAKESMVKEKLAKANEKMETDNKQLHSVLRCRSCYSGRRKVTLTSGTNTNGRNRETMSWQS